MKKLIAIVIALGVSGGLAFAKYSNNVLYSVDADEVGLQSTAVVSLEQAVEQKLADMILVAQLNRDVEAELQSMKSEMDAELESELVARLDSIELAR